MIEPQVDEVTAVTGIAIKAVTADAGYSYGKVYGALEQRGINALIPAKAEPIRSRVPLRRFRYDAKYDLLRCPTGRILRPARPIKHGRFFYSKARDCARCPLKSDCLSKGRVNKAVVAGDHYPALLRARRRRECWSAEDLRLYQRHRWRSEGFHGEAKTWHGLARAVRRGLANMKIQAYLTAAAINLKRLAAAVLALFARWTLCRSLMGAIALKAGPVVPFVASSQPRQTSSTTPWFIFIDSSALCRQPGSARPRTTMDLCARRPPLGRSRSASCRLSLLCRFPQAWPDYRGRVLGPRAAQLLQTCPPRQRTSWPIGPTGQIKNPAVSREGEEKWALNEPLAVNVTTRRSRSSRTSGRILDTVARLLQVLWGCSGRLKLGLRPKKRGPIHETAGVACGLEPDRGPSIGGRLSSADCPSSPGARWVLSGSAVLQLERVLYRRQSRCRLE